MDGNLWFQPTYLIFLNSLIHLDWRFLHKWEQLDDETSVMLSFFLSFTNSQYCMIKAPCHQYNLWYFLFSEFVCVGSFYELFFVSNNFQVANLVCHIEASKHLNSWCVHVRHVLNVGTPRTHFGHTLNMPFKVKYLKHGWHTFDIQHKHLSTIMYHISEHRWPFYKLFWVMHLRDTKVLHVKHCKRITFRVRTNIFPSCQPI